MTPLQLQMLLHYHCRAEPYAMREAAHANSPAVIEQRAQLFQLEMLRMNPDSGSGYELTERGRAYVYELLSIPLPVSKWVIPPREPKASALHPTTRGQ